MSYTALYRKFRPATFADVKGQDHIVTTLRNQLKAGRIGHAYLFTGTRGTGKTTIAKIFARTVNCENPTEDGPCGECRICKAIAAGASMNVIEIDAASNNGVDNIREIVDEVSYSPAEGKYKVYIIDEVHMLSIGAFNALLKTLEEPPSYVIFILATTEVHKLPITILSRCQRYDFKRISIDTITERLKELTAAEAVQVEDRALRYIAKMADGSMRDALSLLDQCIAFHLGDELTYDMVLDVLGAVDTEVFSRLLRHVLDRDVNGCVQLLEEIVMQGRELTQFVTDFTWYLRNLMLVQTSDNLEDVIDMSSENLARLKEEASLLDVNRVVRYIRIFSDLSGQIKYAAQKRILVEIALIKLCKPQTEKNTDSILDRIRQIEEDLKNGSFTPIAAASSAPQTVPAKEIRVLPEAVSEDIKKITGSWQGVVARADNPLKTYLNNVLAVNDTDDGKLRIVLEDGLESDFFLGNEEHRLQTERLVSEFVGKQVSIVFDVAKDGAAAKQIEPDYRKLFGQQVEIVLEEESSDEDDVEDNF